MKTFKDENLDSYKKCVVDRGGDGMSGGTITSIVVGVILAIIIIGGIIFYCMKRK